MGALPKTFTQGITFAMLKGRLIEAYFSILYYFENKATIVFVFRVHVVMIPGPGTDEHPSQCHTLHKTDNVGSKPALPPPRKEWVFVSGTITEIHMISLPITKPS